MKSGKPQKTATKGPKLIYEENCSTLSFYTRIFFVVNALYFSLTILLFWSTFTYKNMFMSGLCVLLYYGGLYFMKFMANATFDGNQLVDPGFDLNASSGTAEHVKDLLLATAAIQLVSLIHNYFWFLFLIIPGYGFYLLWVNVLGPWFFAPSSTDTAQDDKKQKKMEKKLKRQQNMR